MGQTLRPGADIQLAAVDDARKFKQDREPAANPNPVAWGNIHVVTRVFPQGLHMDTAGSQEMRGKRKNKTTESRTKTGVFPARAVSTCGLSETYLAQCRMSLMASMLVSGKAALHTNSDRHFTASWKESIAAAKCSRKVFTDKRQKHAK